jgi:hypothetical protein
MRLSYGTHQKSWLKADARAELNGARRPRARNHPKISGAECKPGDVEVHAVQQVVCLARSSSVMPSPRAARFSSVRSVVATPGPRRTDRGELPNVNGAGFTKAEVLNHRESVRWRGGRTGSATRSGRSGRAGNAFVVFALVTTVNGGPDCSVSTTPIRQRPRTALRYGLSATPGTSYKRREHLARDGLRDVRTLRFEYRRAGDHLDCFRTFLQSQRDVDRKRLSHLEAYLLPRDRFEAVQREYQAIRPREERADAICPVCIRQRVHRHSRAFVDDADLHAWNGNTSRILDDAEDGAETEDSRTAD